MLLWAGIIIRSLSNADQANKFHGTFVSNKINVDGIIITVDPWLSGPCLSRTSIFWN